MHKIFGSKDNIQYYDREGAYFIPVSNGKLGVIHTPKGYFFVGGGIENGESHSDCIKRESLEETGYTVSSKAKVCSAETYCFHNEIGYFHPVQTYYTGEFISKVSSPTEDGHEFLWIKYENIKGKMFWKMQNWALDIVYKQYIFRLS